MVDLSSNIQVRAFGLDGAPCTLEGYLKSVRAYLERLQAIHPIFSRLSILRSKNYEPIEMNLAGLEAALHATLEEGSTLDAGHGSHDSATKLTLDSGSKHGFVINIFSYGEDEQRSHRSVASGGVHLVMRGVSSIAERSSDVALTLPLALFVEEEAAFLVRRIIMTTLDVWPVQFASARTLEFERAISEEGDICSGQWLTYLPFTGLENCLPHGIDWEPYREGTLITTTHEVPRSANPSHVAAAKRLREALDHLGLVWHSTYAIHGWPPDEEEWRYEEFITGAPRDRKYRVRCIDFDGYDAQRDVLLYAKLFRRLRQQRKEWGLRGWDGPVLNEARRQVRAANGTQIEWHVGLEEPAARVRTLLADYTDFKEEQLRVLYTPVSQMAAR